MRLAQLPLRAVAGVGRVRTPSCLALLPSWATTHQAEPPPSSFCGPSPWRHDAGVVVEGRRYASVASQGAYRIPNKKTIAKKMGAKKSGDQYVIPGNIIYKQRGTIWFPGENTLMGRDHTIHAAATGYVKFYRDPARHPKRQYIGVAFNRDDTLPYPAHGVRRRKLNMVAVPRKEAAPQPELSPSGIPTRVVRKEGKHLPQKRLARLKGEGLIQHSVAIRRGNRVLHLRDDYSYRESNAAIGRLMGYHKGKTPGTVRLGTRKGLLRARRRRRERELADLKAVAAHAAAARKEAAEKAEIEAANLAARAAAAAAKAAAAKAKRDEEKKAGMSKEVS